MSTYPYAMRNPIIVRLHPLEGTIGPGIGSALRTCMMSPCAVGAWHTDDMHLEYSLITSCRCHRVARMTRATYNRSAADVTQPRRSRMDDTHGAAYNDGGMCRTLGI